MNIRTKTFSQVQRQKGLALTEALIAAAVMAFGLFGLAFLQMSLTRASADARAASLAAQVATEVIESERAFTTPAQYMAIANITKSPRVVNNQTFEVSQTVRRFRYNPDPDGNLATNDGAFSVVDNTLAMGSTPEFKEVAVNVAWVNTLGERKAIGLVDSISAATPQDGLAAAKSFNGERQSPQVRIHENTETGVIPIAVGQEDGHDVATASSNPKPKQYAEGATGTTKFVVDTYLRDQTNPLLQRKLDFAYASCVCKKGPKSTKASPAFAPTYWDGLRYTLPEQVVDKPTGVRDTGVDQDPQLCDTCCRDHHDELSASVNNDPWRTSSDYTSGDHNHYKSGATVGSLAMAGENDSYLESCRMVRVDGLYQVATDTRLEQFNLVRMSRPDDANVTMAPALMTSYAEFVKKYVTQAFKDKTSSYPIGGLPNALEKADGAPTQLAWDYELAPNSPYVPAFLDYNRNNKVATVKDRTHYLNSRGIYIDWLSPKALERIACIGQDDTKCTLYKNMNILQMVPFVAVNLTQLSMWGSEQPAIATVRNDPVPLVSLKGGGKTSPFIRGKVIMVGTGEANVYARMNRSNSGLINTKPIDPEDASQVKVDYEEFTTAVSSGTTSPPAVFRINITDATASKNFASQNVLASIVEPVVTTPVCASGTTSNTTNQRTCVLDKDQEPVRLIFGNYNYYTCAGLGNKWVYDGVNNKCVLPAQNKNETPQYADPAVRNFALCSVTGNMGGVAVSTVTTLNDNTATETSYVDVSRNGNQTLKDTLASSTLPTFTATFKTTCP